MTVELTNLSSLIGEAITELFIAVVAMSLEERVRDGFESWKRNLVVITKFTTFFTIFG